MQASLTPGRVDAQIKRMAPRHKCLAPDSMMADCSIGTINAHTISRSGSLGAIARDGHVYSLKPSLQSLQKSGGKILPILVGWREASTFPGFCGAHDKSLFAPLEDQQFIGSAQQCFLLAYRIIAREFYTKLGSSLQSDFRDALVNDHEDLLRSTADFNFGVDLGLRDAKRHKKRYDKVLETSDWKSVRSVFFRFNSIFPIQCAGGFFPERDINGKIVQVLGVGKKSPDAITVSSFSAGGNSYISFCWLADSDRSCSAYMSALLELHPDHLPAVLAAVLLQTSENCHFSPDWYDSLPEEGMDWIRLQNTVGLPLFALLPEVAPPATYKRLPYFSDLTVESVESSR